MRRLAVVTIISVLGLLSAWAQTSLKQVAPRTSGTLAEKKAKLRQQVEAEKLFLSRLEAAAKQWEGVLVKARAAKKQPADSGLQAELRQAAKAYLAILLQDEKDKKDAKEPKDILKAVKEFLGKLAEVTNFGTATATAEAMFDKESAWFDDYMEPVYKKEDETEIRRKKLVAETILYLNGPII